jgi:hypothetical protein
MTAALTAATAEPPVIVGKWLIAPSIRGDSCLMTTRLNNDVSFMYSWNVQTQERRVSVFSANWDSLRSRSGQTTRLDLNFSGITEFAQWRDDRAMIVATDSGTEGLTASFPDVQRDDFILALATASGVSIEAEGQSLGSYDLSGVSDAIIAMGDCGLKITGEGRDPVAD